MILPNLPVTAIEGIGPAMAEAFEKIHVYVVFDLLRASVKTLHQAVKSLASEAEVQSWKSSACLLQVSEVTPQWAEALVHGGITSIEELSRKKLADIDAILTQAKDQRMIPDVPTANQIANILRDAAIIHHTGTITGTIRDSDGTPVNRATIRIGTLEEQSDEHGRFRILRIPLGSVLPLYICHSDYVARCINDPFIARDVNLVSGRIFVLEKSLDEDRSMPQAPLQSLSELAGDVLPIKSGQRVKAVEMQPIKLRPMDILKLHKKYESAPDAKIVSLLKSYEDGTIIVHTWRTPLSQLPASAQIGDHFKVLNGKLVKVKMDVGRLQRYKMRLQLYKAQARRLKPHTLESINQQMSEDLKYLVENGYFGSH